MFGDQIAAADAKPSGVKPPAGRRRKPRNSNFLRHRRTDTQRQKRHPKRDVRHQTVAGTPAQIAVLNDRPPEERVERSASSAGSEPVQNTSGIPRSRRKRQSSAQYTVCAAEQPAYSERQHDPVAWKANQIRAQNALLRRKECSQPAARTRRSAKSPKAAGQEDRAPRIGDHGREQSRGGECHRLSVSTRGGARNALRPVGLAPWQIIPITAH